MVIYTFYHLATWLVNRRHGEKKYQWVLAVKIVISEDIWFNLQNRCIYFKTQNSGLRSKEEKPHDPINEPSRCNMQEGLLSVAQTGDSGLLGGRAPQTANWAGFYGQKTHIISILHTGYKVIGYMFAKQSYWYKLCGLWFKLRRPRAFQLSRGLYIDWLAPGHPMGAGNPTISWETETQVLAACQPQPWQPHIIKLISQL